MLDPICSSNQYVVRYTNWSLDTMFCSDLGLVRGINQNILRGKRQGRNGGIDAVVRVPTLADLDLQSAKLQFNLCPN